MQKKKRKGWVLFLNPAGGLIGPANGGGKGSGGGKEEAGRMAVFHS